MNLEVTKEKKGNKIIIVLIMIICIGLGIGIGYLIFHNEDNEDNKGNEHEVQESVINNQEKNKKEIDSTTKKELLDILGLTETGLTKGNAFGIQMLLLNFDVNKEIIINNLSQAKKLDIIATYSNDELIKQISDDDTPLCPDGCFGISEDNYNKIAKKYGITDNINSIFNSNLNYNNSDRYYYLGKYKDLYLFNNASASLFDEASETIKDNYKMEIKDDDIYVTYTLDYYETYSENINKTATYTFKQNNDNSFYLYSVYIKNN